jgi:hypothetical protein
MSFFSRKPNPGLPPAVLKSLRANGPTGPVGPVGPVGSPGVAGQSNDAQQQRPSNQRFRSFAERYIIERCRDWPQREVDERTWAAILEAKSIYNKVKEVGRTLGDDT